MAKDKVVRFSDEEVHLIDTLRTRCPLAISDMDIIRAAMSLLKDFINDEIDDSDDSMKMYTFLKKL